MPLLALVDGDRRVATLLDDNEWVQLRADVKASRVEVILPRCNSRAFLRESTLGTRHFVHARGTGTCSEHPGETAQHLRAKQIIIESCIAAGWRAEPEVCSDDLDEGSWVADVLATRGRVRIAFEVQWSYQTEDEYVRRQKRYERDGIRAAWFAKKTRTSEAPRTDLPVFQLTEVDGGRLLANVAGQTALANAVNRLLSGRCKYRENLGGNPRETSVQLWRFGCGNCKKPYVIWTAQESSAVGRCGQESWMWGPVDKFEAEFGVWAKPDLVRAAQNAIFARGLAPANVPLLTNKTSNEQFSQFHCPHCNWGINRRLLLWFVRNNDKATLGNQVIKTEPLLVRLPHWCLDRGNGNCPE